MAVEHEVAGTAHLESGPGEHLGGIDGAGVPAAVVERDPVRGGPAQ